MATPNITMRVPPEYRDLVRTVVARLKQDRSFAELLQSALDAADQEPVPDINERLAALEARVQEQAQALAATAEMLATMHASFKFSVNQRLIGLDERVSRFEQVDLADPPEPVPYDHPEVDWHDPDDFDHPRR